MKKTYEEATREFEKWAKDYLDLREMTPPIIGFRYYSATTQRIYEGWMGRFSWDMGSWSILTSMEKIADKEGTHVPWTERVRRWLASGKTAEF